MEPVNQLDRFRTILETLRTLKRVIARKTDSMALAQNLCEVISETAGYHGAWIGLFDKNQSIFAWAEAGQGKSYKDAVDDIKAGNAPECWHRSTNPPDIAQLIPNSEHCPSCALSGPESDCRARCARLASGGMLYGILTVSMNVNLADDPIEQQLFTELAADITFALAMRAASREKDALLAHLKNAEGQIHILRGMLPICSYCKQIRDDQGYWNRMESYIEQHSSAVFSHAICPSCLEQHHPETTKNRPSLVGELFAPKPKTHK